MREREIFITELWKRLSSVVGVNRTARNPASSPNIDDFPIIQFFELDDDIISQSQRGGYPIYKRKLNLVIEAYITATKEALSSKELGSFVQEVKKKIYFGGNSLNNTCSLLIEKRASRVLRPPVGDHSVGISIPFEVIYIEDISKLY